VGLVVANMVGAGVFLSAGFMAQDMGPGLILLAWVVGAVLAMAGARAYAEIAMALPRSGGEYRFLSELLHPFLGYLAGWASLLVGFSAPVAVSALAAGHFAATLFPSLAPHSVGVVLIVLLTAAHAEHLDPSRRTQNLLVALKALLLLGFIVVGLRHCGMHWPQWMPQAAAAGPPLGPFFTSLFYVAFAFSGWNAAIYVAEEFARPARDVPRAMLVGCALVGVLYLVVNWVFVASLTPERAAVVFNYERDRITLGHLVMRDAVGAIGGQAMSAVTLLALASSVSAMTMAGPRVYAAMAADGFLPSIFAGAPGRPPAASVILQGGLALVILFTHTLQQTLQGLGGILTLFAALTCLGVFRLRRLRPERPTAMVALVAAAVYVAFAAAMLHWGFRQNPHLLAWVGVTTILAGVAYALNMRSRRRAD
jgi:basic amino acid/polyamine antiporter, APA family